MINRLKTRERRRAAEKQRFVHVLTEPIQGYFGPEVILKACQALRQHFSFLENRCIYYFIDDYSGFDHGAGHFRPLKIMVAILKLTFSQWVRFFPMRYGLLGWPAP